MFVSLSSIEYGCRQSCAVHSKILPSNSGIPRSNLESIYASRIPTEKTLQEQQEAWAKAAETVSGDITKIRSAIEVEFRTLLGADQLTITENEQQTDR